MAEAQLEINEAYLEAWESKERYIVLKGGSGSGKSVFCAQKFLFRTTTTENERLLVVRKVRTTLRMSVFQLFIDLINKYGMHNRFTINKTDMQIKDRFNGSTINFFGIDDQEKLKSIQGISSIWVEEATEIDEEDFDQLNLRLRGDTAGYKQILLSFNPISVHHWLKTDFFDNPPPNIKTVETNFQDNAFLDEEYKNMLLERFKTKENWWRIYVLNLWGTPQTGEEFYSEFKMTKHVKKVVYNPELSLHISYDFNVNPYMSLSIWQIEGTNLYNIDEIAAKTPNNNTKAITRMFADKYKNHSGGLYVYGDPSGKAQDTRSEKGWNDYRIIEKELPLHFRAAFRVAKSAPSVKGRGDFINAVLSYNYSGLNIVIDPKCERLIEDFSYLKEAADGGKHKEKQKNKATGITSEKFGHFSDCFDYLICEAFKNVFRDFQRPDRANVSGITGRDSLTSRKSLI